MFLITLVLVLAWTNTNAKTIDKQRMYSTVQHQLSSRTKLPTIPVKTTPTESSETIQDITSSSGVTSHYQVITICNTLPSILKCQNRQHYLILHRVTYGISDSTAKNECVLKSKCLELDKNDEFNCTGSNICVFYPNERYLNSCKSIRSNLTQIQIACVSLLNLKKYLIHRNPSLIQSIQSLQNTDKFIDTFATSTNLPPPSFNLTTNDDINKFFVSINETSLNFSLSTIKPFNKLFTFATPITFLTTNSSSSSLVISITIFCIFLAIVVMSLIYYKIKIKQILAQSTRTNMPKNSSNQQISASFNTNSNCQIYMSNNSQVSFKSLPNMPPPPAGFIDMKSTQNSKSCSDLDSKNKLKQVLKSNYDNIHKKLNRKLSSIQGFFQEYVYSSNQNQQKNTSNQNITRSNISISEPRLIIETPNTPKKGKDEDIFTIPGKLRLNNSNSNQSDYYQINAKILSVLASNQNLLKKKSSIKDINELIQKSRSNFKDNQSFVDEEEQSKKTIRKSNSTKKLVRESESSSSSDRSDDDDDDEEVIEEMSESQEDDDPHDYVPYYQRNYGLNGTYMLYDIPEEDIDDTQDSLENDAAPKK